MRPSEPPQARARRRCAGLLKFTPFDPGDQDVGSHSRTRQGPLRAVKGAFAVVIGLAQPHRRRPRRRRVGEQGFRVLAVAVGPPAACDWPGSSRSATRLAPTPRRWSRNCSTLGVAVMVTGDAPATAAIVAHAVGSTALSVRRANPDRVRPDKFAVFAGVLPEDKYSLVKAFQKTGHTVGMCGDGANDAPALRQAQIGLRCPPRPTSPNRQPASC